jgi:hypothetical protein
MTLNLLFLVKWKLYGSLSYDFDGVNLHHFTVMKGNF